MEKEISGSLTNLISRKTLQLTINKQYRNDLDEILRTSHGIVHDVSVVSLFFPQGKSSPIGLASSICTREINRIGKDLSNNFHFSK